MTKTLTLEERRKKKQELAAEIRKQGKDYDERRKAGGEAWPDATREAWTSVNKEYDENEQELIRMTNDDEVSKRVQQMREDEEQSRRTGHKPGLDDRLPGENRTYGELGLDRDGAAELAQRQNDTRLAFRTYILAGTPDLITDEMREACERVGYKPGQKTYVRLHRTQSIKAAQRQLKSMNHAQRAMALETGELRALSKFTAGAGPELVPQTFVNTLEMAMLANGNMLAYFDTITTDTGETMNWPIADDTSNEGDWVDAEGEDTQTVGEPNPVFKRTSWDAHELHSKWIKVPISLNEDAMFDIEVILATMMGERLGRSINTASTVGDGVKKCRGIMLDAPLGHTCASATAIAYDDIVKLEHSVDPSYRTQSQFAMHDSVLETLRLLKDGEGRPLWQVSMRDGTPDRLHNREYAYNQAMADTVEASAETMLFGRLSDYKLRRVGQMRIIRANERFAEKLQIGFLGYIRVDGKLLRPTSDARTSVKKMAQAA